MYAVINSATKKISKNYAVIDGVTRKITKIYGVVDGVTKLIWSEDDDGIQLLSSGVVYSIATDEGQCPTFMYNYDSSSTSLDDKLIELPIDSLSWQYSADLNYYVEIVTNNGLTEAKLYQYNNSTSSYSTLIKTINVGYVQSVKCRWALDNANFTIVAFYNSQIFRVKLYDHNGTMLNECIYDEYDNTSDDDMDEIFLKNIGISPNLDTICYIYQIGTPTATHTDVKVNIQVVHSFKNISTHSFDTLSYASSQQYAYIATYPEVWFSYDGTFMIVATSKNYYYMTDYTAVYAYMVEDSSVTRLWYNSFNNTYIKTLDVLYNAEASTFCIKNLSSVWYTLSESGMTEAGVFSLGGSSSRGYLQSISYNEPTVCIGYNSQAEMDGTYKDYDTGSTVSSTSTESVPCLQTISWNSDGCPTALTANTKQICFFTGIPNATSVRWDPLTPF